MNSKWIKWSMMLVSTFALGTTLVASGCSGSNSAEIPEDAEKAVKSDADKGSKESFASEKGMPELDPKLESELQKDVEE